jgi:NAD(P)-dependent dehydrogenase (short-subunit alcohol dehydrogenase family)
VSRSGAVFDLRGKTVLITGANGALGGAVAARAQSLGASLLLASRRFDTGLAGRFPDAWLLEIDLAEPGALQAALSQAGSVDVLFNIAGGFAMGESSYDAAGTEWDAMFRINVQTLRHTLAAVVPGMLAQGRGSVVNVGALSALHGQAGMGAYIASKSAVLRLTESLSAEVRERGVNVNAVLPSIIDTPANRSAMPDADPARWVSPDDLASVICFLGSDAARAIHGALVPVAGLSG